MEGKWRWAIVRGGPLERPPTPPVPIQTLAVSTDVFDSEAEAAAASQEIADMVDMPITEGVWIRCRVIDAASFDVSPGSESLT